jgi:hypothetical protein
MSTNNNQQSDFDILKVIDIARTKKYEITSAGFAALDKIDKISFSKKMKIRKPAVQALYAITENLIQYEYFSPEERKKYVQEANMSDAPYSKGFKNLFPSSAPVAEEAMEEEIPEEVVLPIASAGEDDEYGDEEASDFDEEEEEDSFDEEEDD